MLEGGDCLATCPIESVSAIGAVLGIELYQGPCKVQLSRIHSQMKIGFFGVL